MPRDCLSLLLDKGLGVFRNHSSKLCHQENDSTYFCASLGMPGGNGKAAFPSLGCLYWQCINLLFIKHLERHFNQSQNAAILLLCRQCCIICCKHKHPNPCPVCAFLKEEDDIKDFRLYCIPTAKYSKWSSENMVMCGC